MTTKEFNRLVIKQIERSLITLETKGDGYAMDDRLDHFKRAAAMMGTTPEMALMGMASKHFISVAKLCQETAQGKVSPLATWDEKIGDAVNYLLILAALIREYREDSHETN